MHFSIKYNTFDKQAHLLEEVTALMNNRNMWIDNVGAR